MQNKTLIILISVAQMCLFACQSTQQTTEQSTHKQPHKSDRVSIKTEPEAEQTQASDIQLKPEIIKPEILKQVPAEQTITLGFVGDILLAGSAQSILEKKGYDFPFVNLQPTLDQNDILFGNLEGPLTNFDEIYIEKTYAFRSDPVDTAQALANAGFDVVSLANNHGLDYGWQGMQDTQNVLDEFNIQYVGAGQNKTQARTPVIIEKEGIKIGYLAYNNTYPKEFWATDDTFGVAYGKQSEFLQDLKALTQISDIQIISFHWGREGQTQLRDYQTLFARAAIDAGADIVVGHHPHILQAIERYNDGLILYSIGNFTFGTYGKLAQTSGIFNVEVSKTKVKMLEVTGLNVFNKEIAFQPKLLDDVQMKELFDQVSELSHLQNTQLKLIENKMVLEF